MQNTKYKMQKYKMRANFIKKSAYRSINGHFCDKNAKRFSHVILKHTQSTIEFL